MAFLDNSGDIILDAVLTDLGRKRLAKGDGSFAIRKFALADDEIDYGLYDKDNLNGSPYYDLVILQTPVLEASTKSGVGLKSRLLTYPNNDILYLPVMKLFLGGTNGTDNTGETAQHATNTFVVVADTTTETNLNAVGQGIMTGWRSGTPNLANIRVDQGLNSSDISNTFQLDAADIENQWVVRMDDRLGQIAPPPAATATGTPSTSMTFASASPSFRDSNNIATYYFTSTGASAVSYVSNIGGGDTPSSIVGARGMMFQFRVIPSLDLATSNFLFRTLGRTATTTFDPGATGGNTLAAATWRFIDSTVNITGVNTQSSIDVPIRYIQSIS